MNSSDKPAKQNFHPRISVSQISAFNWSLEQMLAFWSAEGIETAGFLHFKLEPDVEASIEAIKRSGLRPSCVVAGAMNGALISAVEDNGAQALAGLSAGIDAASALSAPCYFTSGITPPRMTTDDAYAMLVHALGPVVDHARARNVRLALEHNSTSTRNNGFIHTLSDAVDLSRDTGVGICLELQNCWMERHLDRMFRENVDRFVIAQVSDFLVGEEPRLNRRVPGDGSMPLEWMLQRLLDAGYEGLFEIEVLGPRIEEEGYESAIRRSVDWLSSRLSSWGA